VNAGAVFQGGQHLVVVALLGRPKQVLVHIGHLFPSSSSSSLLLLRLLQLSSVLSHARVLVLTSIQGRPGSSLFWSDQSQRKEKGKEEEKLRVGEKV
jgi:hypothetical protein